MSYHNIWQAFAFETGGEHIAGQAWLSDKTLIEYKDHKIIFDHFDLWSGKYSKAMTRVVIPIQLTDNFRFEIYRSGFVRRIEKLFGAQDLKIGDESFDKAFIVKANDEYKIKSLLQNKKIRQLLSGLKDVNLVISDSKGIWEEKLPENEFELSFFMDGAVQNINTLKMLLMLMMELLDELQKIKLIL